MLIFYLNMSVTNMRYQPCMSREFAGQQCKDQISPIKKLQLRLK